MDKSFCDYALFLKISHREILILIVASPVPSHVSVVAQLASCCNINTELVSADEHSLVQCDRVSQILLKVCGI